MLFFGHDYGWKNYLWASDYLFGGKETPSDAANPLSSYRESVEHYNRELMEIRRSGKANTGTLLSLEIEKNPFMRAYLES